MKKSNVIIAAVVLILLAGGIFALRSNTAKPQASTQSPMAAAPAGGPMAGPPGSGQFAEFQKSHKYAFQLMRQIGNIGRLEDEGKASLSPAQAKSVLAILQPLREQKSLSEPTAKEALKALQAVITDEQRSAISALPPEHQFRRKGPMPGPPSSGAPANPPAGVGPNSKEGFNPLNSTANGPAGDETNKLFDNLKGKSASK